jgi:hypothetical protein
MDQATQQNAAMAEESTAASVDLVGQASSLTQDAVKRRRAGNNSLLPHEDQQHLRSRTSGKNFRTSGQRRFWLTPSICDQAKLLCCMSNDGSTGEPTFENQI